jgi:small ligand-binding sensory domain FIST
MSEKRFVEALSTLPDWRAAAADAARRARAKLGPVPCDLALVFVSQTWADFDPKELPGLLAKELAPLHSLGCNASGVISGRREVEMEPGVSILAMRLPGASVRGVHFAPSELARLEDGAALVAALDLYPTEMPKFITVADPVSCDAERWLELLGGGYPGCPVVGGLASGVVLRKPSWLLCDGHIHADGAAAAVLTGDVDFRAVVAQGCRPIGEPLIITRAEGNVLQELGSRQPLEVLRETLSRCTPEDQRLARHSLFAGLLMDERRSSHKRGDFVVRNLVGFDPESGHLVVGAPLRRGQTLQFQLRDAATSDQDLQSLLGRLPEAGASPRGALLVTCCGRGKGLYGEPDHDATVVQTMRGPLPMAGFFANGEFGQVGGRNFVHGYTSSLIVIS